MLQEEGQKARRSAVAFRQRRDAESPDHKEVYSRTLQCKRDNKPEQSPSQAAAAQPTDAVS